MSMIDDLPQSPNLAPEEVPSAEPIDPAIIDEERQADRQGTETWYGNSGLEALQDLRGGLANDPGEQDELSAIKESLKDPEVPATTSETARTEFVELTDDEKVGHPPSHWPRLVREKQKKLQAEEKVAKEQELLRRALEARDKRIRAQEDSDLGISA
jgi:hypothetical protein